MARRRYSRKKRGHRKKTTVPVALLLGAGSGAISAWSGGRTMTEKLALMKKYYVGVGSDGIWKWDNMVVGWAPMAAGFIAHKAASRFGLNAALGRAGVPLLRV